MTSAYGQTFCVLENIQKQ